MFLLMIVCPFMYMILTFLGNRSNHFRTKPRFLTYGKTFLLDVPFMLLLINVSNICVSFVVSFQSFGFSNSLSFISSVILVLTIIVGVILFIVFNEHFR